MWVGARWLHSEAMRSSGFVDGVAWGGPAREGPVCRLSRASVPWGVCLPYRFEFLRRELRRLCGDGGRNPRWTSGGDGDGMSKL